MTGDRTLDGRFSLFDSFLGDRLAGATRTGDEGRALVVVAFLGGVSSIYLLPGLSPVTLVFTGTFDAGTSLFCFDG